jgi:CMP-N-acetylneuraminic acid synthetase
MSADALKETGARYGKNNTVAYVLPDDAVINIDEPIDLIVAEAMLRKKK